MKRKVSLLLGLGWFALSIQGQEVSDQAWQDVEEADIPRFSQRFTIPDFYRTLRVDRQALTGLLSGAPAEGAGTPVFLQVPMPDGGYDAFLVERTPVMAPALAARYPEIQTYRGRGLTDPTALLRFDVTQLGVHAMVLSARGSYYIDPYQQNDRDYCISYYTADYRMRPGESWFCDAALLDSRIDGGAGDGQFEGTVFVEGELLTYRVAIAATGEYTNFHGGTVPDGLAAIVTALNRVNGIYEREVAIRMELVADNDMVVYTNSATDPYTNNNGFAMLGENQANLDAVIGSANYDIGHVFSTGGGGIAGLGVTCTGGKARGVTGLPSPTGDVFYVDFVAHEMGHQYAASHTFNGTTGNCGGGNRSASSAYEPGSGSTIMAYAGICGGENLQPNSDDYFHTRSFDQIVNFTRNGAGSSCPVQTAVANDAPTVDAGSDFNIPMGTPFALTGSATDPDLAELGGDSLSYNWEQFDLGAAAPPNTDNGNRPIFRSFASVLEPTRTFPRLSDILNNTSSFGESLPTTTRVLTFRLTVRDNHPGGGGVDYDTVQLNVTSGAGPFLVTAPNTAVTWAGNSMETVSWNTASTDQAPVSCANVDILLSTDGGLSFDTVVASGVPNTGSAMVQVPNIDTTSARLKVVCSDNIFFDISNANFTIEMAPLVCTTEFENWRASTSLGFVDSNGNGVVDVADFVVCSFP